MADFVIGLFATGDMHGPGAVARGVHVLVSLATVVVLLGIHSIVYTYFIATGKWAKEVVTVYQLPDWINAQAKKNKRRAFRFIMWSMTAIAVAAVAGRGLGYSGPFLHALAPGGSGARGSLQFRVVHRGVQRDRCPCATSQRAERTC